VTKQAPTAPLHNTYITSKATQCIQSTAGALPGRNNFLTFRSLLPGCGFVSVSVNHQIVWGDAYYLAIQPCYEATASTFSQQG